MPYLRRRRFVGEAERLLGALEPLGPGLWRSEVLGRLVFLVSSIDLPVEPDSLPLHIVGQEPLATERRVAQLVVEQPELQHLYGGWMASLHSSAWKEIEAMVRRTGKGLNIDLEAAIDAMGVDRIIDTVGIERVIEILGAKRFIEKIGAKRILDEFGVEDFLANLSPEDRRALKRQLE